MEPTVDRSNKSRLNSTTSLVTSEADGKLKTDSVNLVSEKYEIDASNILDQNFTKENNFSFHSNFTFEILQACGSNVLSDDFETSSSSSNTDESSAGHIDSDDSPKTQTEEELPVAVEKVDKVSHGSPEYEYRNHPSSLSVLNELELDEMSGVRSYRSCPNVDEDISFSREETPSQSNLKTDSPDSLHQDNVKVSKEDDGAENDLNCYQSSPSLSADNSQQSGSGEFALQYGVDESGKQTDDKSVLLLEGRILLGNQEDQKENGVASDSSGHPRSPTITLDEVSTRDTVNRDEIISEKEIKELEKLSPMFSRSSAENSLTLQVPQLGKGAIVDIHTDGENKSRLLEKQNCRIRVTLGKLSGTTFDSGKSLSGDQRSKNKFLLTSGSTRGPFCRHGRGIRGERIYDEFCDEDHSLCHCQLHKRIIRRSTLESLCNNHREEMRELYGSKTGGHYSKTETDLLCYKHDEEVKHGKVLHCHCILKYGGMGALRALQNGVNLYDLCYEHDRELSQYTHEGDSSGNQLHHHRLQNRKLCQQHDEYMKLICQEYNQISGKINCKSSLVAAAIKNT